jgi:Pentapeptide repeats (8 copies)
MPNYPNFTNQNLQNRTFKGLDLRNANFGGADIRGCDFSYAQLQNANFTEVKVGQAPRFLIILIVVAFLNIIIAFPAVSQMSFGVLGRTPEESSWSYTVALFVSLGIAGTFAAIRGIIYRNLILQRIATILSGAASGALLGFYYGGSSQNNNPQIAVMSSAIAFLVMAIISFYITLPYVIVTVAALGFIAAYGFTFLILSLALAYLSTQNLILGIIFSFFALCAIAMTIFCLKLVIQEIATSGITSFRYADLTNAKLDSIDFKKADFRDAWGMGS